MVPAFLDANKKEFETHDTVNESKVTIKCLLIMIYTGFATTGLHKAGDD